MYGIEKWKPGQEKYGEVAKKDKIIRLTHINIDILALIKPRYPLSLPPLPRLLH